MNVWMYNKKKNTADVWLIKGGGRIWEGGKAHIHTEQKKKYQKRKKKKRMYVKTTPPYLHIIEDFNP